MDSRFYVTMQCQSNDVLSQPHRSQKIAHLENNRASANVQFWIVVSTTFFFFFQILWTGEELLNGQNE